MAINNNTKITIGAAVGIVTAIVGLLRFTGNPHVENYVDNKVGEISKRIDKMENQQDYLRDRIDKIVDILSRPR